MDIRKNLRCPECGKAYEAVLNADAIMCPHCNHRLSRVDQVSALLDEWYYPRRWYRDIERPRVRLLVERLWQQQFDPHQLYENLAPKETNYEVFCYTVTSVIIKGIEAGWAKLHLPEDPMADDPIYQLEIVNLDRFTEEMERAMPDVDWDEDIEVVDTGTAEPATSQGEATSSEA